MALLFSLLPENKAQKERLKLDRVEINHYFCRRFGSAVGDPTELDCLNYGDVGEMDL